MPRTNWTDMTRYKIVLPDANVLSFFSSHVHQTARHIVASIHESRTLAALRDALLPKLISGELRIQDPEAFLARVLTKGEAP